MVSAIAGAAAPHRAAHRRRSSASQLANTVESVLTLLGVLRAGHDRDAAAAAVAARRMRRRARPRRRQRADRQRARSARPITATSPCRSRPRSFRSAMSAASAATLPDGVVPFDDLFTAETLDPMPPLGGRARRRPGARISRSSPGTSTADGLVPVARSHAELIAGGLAVAARRPPRAGRGAALDPDACRRSPGSPPRCCRGCWSAARWRCTSRSIRTPSPRSARRSTLRYRGRAGPAGRRSSRRPGILPAATASATSSASGARPSGWRARRPGAMPQVAHDRRAGVRRDRPDRRPPRRRRQAGADPVRRRVRCRAARKGAVVVAEIARDRRTARWRCAGRWCRAAPSRPAPSAAACPIFKVAADGFVDTGYACRADQRPPLVVTGPPPGIVSVGGYRFVMRDLQDMVALRRERRGALAALPDALTGHRLAGTAADRDRRSAGARKTRRQSAAGRAPSATGAAGRPDADRRPDAIRPSSSVDWPLTAIA